MIPQRHEIWEKKSFPTPTRVEIVNCDGKYVVSVRRLNRKKSVVVSLAAFLSQGFERVE